MHVTLEKGHFLKALAHQQSVIEKKTTVPILSHVMLTAEKNLHEEAGFVTLTGTDLELCLLEKIPAQVKKTGSVALSVHTLYDIIRKLRDGAPIELELKENQSVSLTCYPSQFILPTLPTADFPVMTTYDLPHRFSLSSKAFRQLIDQTRFAMSTGDMQYYLNGIYFHRVGRDLRAVTTDSHRLALSWIPLPENAEEIPGVILSRKTIHEIRKLIEGVEEDLQISLSSKQISFSFGNAVFYSRLIEGKFPDYHKAIPQTSHHKLVVHAQALAEAVDRVSMISNEKSRIIKMQLSSGCISFSANSPENGFACEDLGVDYGGETIKMGFNARYVLDVAQQMKGEFVQIHLGEAHSPALLKDPKDEQALYVLMPMRV